VCEGCSAVWEKRRKIKKNGQGGAAGRTGRMRRKKSEDGGASRCPSCLQNRGCRREAAVEEEKISGVWAVVEGKWVLMCRTWGWLWVAAREEG